jgi:Fe(3+) dicitrate transport protein
LTITPGLRIEGIHSTLTDHLKETRSERNDLVALPGLGLYFAFTEDLGALGGVYRGFSPAEAGSDEATRPEWSVNYETGLRYSTRSAKAELIGFFNDYQNLTDVCTFSSGCENEQLDRQYDAGRAYIYGLESQASYDLAFGELLLPISAAYTLSYGEFRTSFDSADPIYGSVQKGDQMPYIPRHQLRAQLAAEFQKMGAYAAFTYVSAVRETAGSDPLNEVLRTDPLVKLDVGISAKVLPALELYVHARNLLDYQGIAAHRPFGARPNAPRWIMAGIEFEL